MGKCSCTYSLDNLPTIIYACFIVHNLCEINKESISEDQVRSFVEHEQDLQPTNQWQGPMQRNDVEGKRARGVLTKYFANLHSDN